MKSPILTFDCQRSEGDGQRRLHLAIHLPAVPVIWLGRLVLATALMTLSLWSLGLAGPQLPEAIGFVTGLGFLYVAMDGHGARAGLQALTGLALMALAFLSHSLATEISVISSSLVAAWILVPARFGRSAKDYSLL